MHLYHPLQGPDNTASDRAGRQNYEKLSSEYNMAAVIMNTQKVWLHVQDLYAKVCENGSPSWEEGSSGVGGDKRG